MADDTLRLPCGCVKKYYSGVGWDLQPCTTHAKHEFDPGGRAHWEKPRCKECQAFEEHPIHEVNDG